jgi:hypothetical protein
MESNIEDIIQTKLTRLEEKSKLYKLKRYEKNLMKKYRNLLSTKDKKELAIEKMKETDKKFEQKIKEENHNFEKEKKMIIKEKKETIRQIEHDKKTKIDENNKKYRNLLSYLDTIKNDKKKLIEFFQNSNYF